MLVRALRVRVIPEAMTRLMGLPEGAQMLRFQVMGDGAIECLVAGDMMPENTEPEPRLIDFSELAAILGRTDNFWTSIPEASQPVLSYVPVEEPTQRPPDGEPQP